MAPVTVVAIRGFDHDGHLYLPGDSVRMQPIDAAVAAQRGDVSLNERPTYLTRDLVAPPVTQVQIVVAQIPVEDKIVEPAYPPKRRRGRPRKRPA